jgi:hypothetical protein
MPTLSMSAFGGKADLPDMLRPIFRDCGDFTATDRTLTAQLHTGCLGSFHFLFELLALQSGADAPPSHLSD